MHVFILSSDVVLQENQLHGFWHQISDDNDVNQHEHTDGTNHNPSIEFLRVLIIYPWSEEHQEKWNINLAELVEYLKSISESSFERLNIGDVYDH